jgi:2-iminobutanoate/2-iminopropanoate deaminase
MKKIINSKNAPAPIGPYNQSVMFGNLLFTSGQIALDLEGNLIDSSIESETKQVFNNLQTILDEAQLSFDDVIKVSIFIKDMNDFDKINAVYATYFTSENAPARETVQVAKLPKNVNIEVSLIAGKS